MNRKTFEKDGKIFLRSQGQLKWRAYPRYVLEAHEDLAAYERTGLTPEQITGLQVENAEMMDIITGNKGCRYCKSYPFCCNGDWICLTPDKMKFEWRGAGGRDNQ